MVNGIKILLASAVFLAWLAMVGIGMWWLTHYEHRPGKVRDAAVLWPGDTPLTPASNKPTLVFFVHPKCPCSTASANELARLVARFPEKLNLIALVFEPSAPPPNWYDTAVTRSTERIPDIEIVRDTNGVEARRFGASISGEVMLYGQDGDLRFQGGLTGSRAHEGGNTARDLLERRVRDASLPAVNVPVFGCTLNQAPPPGDEA